MSGAIAKRLLSGATWTLAARVIAALAGIGTSALLARMLTVEEFGVYFMVVSVTVAGALVGQMGAHLAVVRFVAAGMANHAGADLRPVLRGIMLLSAMSSAAVSLLYAGPLGNWLGTSVFKSQLLTAVAGLTAIWLVLRVLQTLSGQALRGFHDLSVASLFDGALSSMLLVALLSIVWLSGNNLGLERAIWLSITAFTVTSGVGLLLVRRHWAGLPACGGIAFGKVARASLPLWISSLAIGGMGEMHLWVLSALRPESDVALYGAASRIFVAIGLPLTLVNSVAQSSAADLYARGDMRRLERMMRITAAAAALPAMVIVSVLIVFAGPFLSLVFGEYYAGAASVLVVLLVGQAVNLMTGSPGMLMAMAGRQKALMFLAVLAGAAGLIVTAMLAARYGPAGAATGLATALVLQNVATSIYCWRLLGVKTIPKLNALDDLAYIFQALTKRA